MTGCKSTWERLQDAGVEIVPMGALNDAAMRSQIRDAEVIYGVDVNTHMGSVFYGVEWNEASGKCKFNENPSHVVAVAIDFDSNELDSLAATTQELKGTCRYDFDRSVPCLMNAPPNSHAIHAAPAQ
jgi:hypothetical protein